MNHEFFKIMDAWYVITLVQVFGSDSRATDSYGQENLLEIVKQILHWPATCFFAWSLYEQPNLCVVDTELWPDRNDAIISVWILLTSELSFSSISLLYTLVGDTLCW